MNLRIVLSITLIALIPSLLSCKSGAGKIKMNEEVSESQGLVLFRLKTFKNGKEIEFGKTYQEAMLRHVFQRNSPKYRGGLEINAPGGLSAFKKGPELVYFNSEYLFQTPSGNPFVIKSITVSYTMRATSNIALPPTPAGAAREDFSIRRFVDVRTTNTANGGQITTRIPTLVYEKEISISTTLYPQPGQIHYIGDIRIDEKSGSSKSKCTISPGLSESEIRDTIKTRAGKSNVVDWDIKMSPAGTCGI